MGLLDKILGRTKETAREIGEHAAPLAEKAGAAVSGAFDKARDAVTDHADDAAAGSTEEAAPPAAEAAAGEAVAAPPAEPETP